MLWDTRSAEPKQCVSTVFPLVFQCYLTLFLDHFRASVKSAIPILIDIVKNDSHKDVRAAGMMALASLVHDGGPNLATPKPNH